MKKIASAIIVFLIILLNSSLNAQVPMSGTYTIGNGQDFMSITSALQNLYFNGADAEVTLVLTNDYDISQETFPVIFTDFPGAGEQNRLIIKPSADFNTDITATTKALFYFNNAHFITIDGSKDETDTRDLTLINNSTIDSSGVIAIDSSSNNIIIKNCNLYSGGNNCMSSGITADNCYNIEVNNNKIAKAQIGVIIKGDSSIIINNEIGSSIPAEYLDFGICIQFGNKALIKNNRIYNLIDDNIYNNENDIHAIALIDMQGVVKIEANYIDSLINTGNSHVVQAIAISDCTTDSLLIINNRISNIASDAYSDKVPCAIAIQAPGLTSAFIAYNSINMPENNDYGLGSGDNNVIASAIAIDGGSGITFKNNIISNTLGNRTGATNITIGADIAISSTDNPFSEIDNNIYFISGDYTLKTIAINPDGPMELSDWQTYTGQENNSVAQESPCFISDDSLQLTACSPAIGRAEYLDNVTTDIDGTSRNPQHPTIGAYTYGIVQASNLQTTTIDTTTINLDWTKGSGKQEVVFIKAIPAEDLPRPQDNTSYSAGDEIDTSGWICVFNGTYNGVITLNNDYGTNIKIMVLEYFGSENNEIYITDTAVLNPIYVSFANKIEQINQDNLKIFPNPTTGKITIDTQSDIKDITLYSNTGKKSMIKNITNNQLDISNLSNGIHFIKITTNKKTFITKIILQK